MISDSLLDQLADYAAGLLDESAAADLRRRLAADPQLAALAREVAGAMERAAADLAAAPAEPMPPDVAARLDALVAAPVGSLPPDVAARLDALVAGSVESPPADIAGATEPLPGGVSEPPPPARHAAGSRPFPQHPGSPHPLPARPASTAPEGHPGAGGARTRPTRAARRGWLRGLALGGGVLGAAALVLGGFVALGGRATQNSTGSQSDVKGAAPASAPLIRHTGTDYTRDTLPTGVGAAAAGQEAGKADTFDSEPLSRLENPAALSDCVTAILALHPGAAREIDFARFQGSPALIVLVETGTTSGTRTVVVGPECGVGGADEVYVTPER
jgi:hypothetical protein